jgi:hypothetical protein
MAGQRAEMGGQESEDSRPWTGCSRGGAPVLGAGGASSGRLQIPAGGAAAAGPGSRRRRRAAGRSGARRAEELAGGGVAARERSGGLMPVGLALSRV